MSTFVADLSSFESHLANRLRTREEGVFQEVFHRFGHKIYRTALKILREEESAKDALQETMINIHRAAGSFRGDSKLSTWINRITVNVCLEMIRKNKKHACRTGGDITDHEHLEDSGVRSPFNEAYRSEIRKRVHRALNQLSEKHRLVVRLHDLEGFTIREIARKLQVAEGTVKSRLFYGREELKAKLIAGN